MNEDLKPILSILIPIIIVIIVFSGAINLGIITFDEPENELKEASVNVIIQYANGQINSYSFTTENSTVLGCLIMASEIGEFNIKSTYYEEYDSTLIEEINNVKNGEDDKYWQFYLNGEYPPIGADKCYVENGDLIEWKFEGFDY